MWAANQHIRMMLNIRMIWVTTADNSALPSQEKKLNCSNISEYCWFYCIFNQINAALVSIRDFFHSTIILEFECSFALILICRFMFLFSVNWIEHWLKLSEILNIVLLTTGNMVESMRGWTAPQRRVCCLQDVQIKIMWTVSIHYFNHCCNLNITSKSVLNVVVHS